MANSVSRRRIARWPLVGVLVLLAGCQGSVQDRLGLSNRAPDEFQVVRRAPLVVPPDYSLTPPDEAASTREQEQSQVVRAVVTGRAETALADASAGERALLSASAVAAVPGIRTLLLEDVGSVKQIDESRFLAILDWQRPTFDGDQALDPVEAAGELEASGQAVKVITNRVGPTGEVTTQ